MSLTDSAAAEEDDFKEVSATNFQKIQAKALKLGYVDGLSDGRDRVFQAGFDQGYTDGFRTGFEIEKFKAFFANVDKDELQNVKLLNEKTTHDVMQLPDVKDKAYFKYLSHQQENLQTISKHQQSYVDDFLKDCQNKMPITTNLLLGANTTGQ